MDFIEHYFFSSEIRKKRRINIAGRYHITHREEKPTLIAGKSFLVSVDPKYIMTFKHTCITCGKTYKHKHHLKRHHDFECGIAPKFKCAFCPHRTRYKDSLMKHILARHQPLLEQNSQYGGGHQQIFEGQGDTSMDLHELGTIYNTYRDYTQNL